MYALAAVFLSVLFGGVFCTVEQLNRTLIVDTKYGKVEGSLSESDSYYEFLGIRYAVPVRFRSPDEPPSHADIYKANNRVVLCAQFPCNDILAAPSENEDCLVLNIFTPAQSNTSLPVMVFLHGGGFGVGSGIASFYGPQFLVSQDIILVTLNYRLNVYGFLNLGIKEAPGNAGLKDIRAALRWIRDNIRNFNGNPDNVTVFGQGSGGIAALYLTLSESTKGLVHKVISESGTLFSPESFDPNPLATAIQVAKSLSSNTVDPEQLLKVYNETTVLRTEEALSKQMHAKTVFLPSVEKIFEGEEPFLVDTPYNILSNPKHDAFNPLPLIVGLNTVESLVSTLDYYTITSEIDRLKHEDYTILDRRGFNVTANNIEDYRKLLRDTYFTNLSSDEEVIGGLINLNTDFSYVGPMSLFSEMYANDSGQPIYHYIFNFTGSRNLGSILTKSSLPATTNMDELFYLFELERTPLPMEKEDARIVSFMTTMWTDFAKFGTPTPQSTNGEWLPYPLHLAIDLEPKYVSPLTPERALFWREFYVKYGADSKKWRQN